MKSYTKQSLQQSFKETFNEDSSNVFECGGRFEVLGNHTDHNHGLCLVAACDLTLGAAIKARKDKTIAIYSKGYGLFEVDINNLELDKKDEGSSKAMVQGICSYFKQNKYKIGGFNAYIVSDIAPGAGVSSSAAFEMMICHILNFLYNKNKIDKIFLAKAGQYAENKYCGKASGLLDQIGVVFGGFNYLDFGDINNPVVKNIPFNFNNLHLVIINTGGSHAELSDLYSSIPSDMKEVAYHFGKKVLRDVDEDEFEKFIAENKDHFSPLATKRAKHFYSENQRVLDGAEALLKNDLQGFFDAVNGSQKSSQNNLCNTQVEDQYRNSPQEAIDYANSLMVNGAAKINGGGFAGTIICYVMDEDYEFFMKKMTARYGTSNVHEINVNPDGPHEI